MFENHYRSLYEKLGTFSFIFGFKHFFFCKTNVFYQNVNRFPKDHMILLCY